MNQSLPFLLKNHLHHLNRKPRKTVIKMMRMNNFYWTVPSTNHPQSAKNLQKNSLTLSIPPEDLSRHRRRQESIL